MALDTNPRPAPAAIPALITPFDEAGHIDLDAHRRNLAALSNRGVAGFLIAGSTGEGPYLLPGERAALLEVAREEATEAFLLCGIAAQSVVQALAQLSELDQADVALVMTPTMFASTPEDQIRFYTAVAQRAELPVWLYTVPGVTGYNLPVPVVTSLAATANIGGIKDSSGIVERIPEIRQTCPDDFMVYAGASRAVAAARLAGANGAITASGNYTWDLINDIVGRSPDDPDIPRLQARLSDLAATVERYGLRGTKFAASLAGLEAGVPRLPLDALDGDAAAALGAALEALG